MKLLIVLLSLASRHFEVLCSNS